MDCEEVHDAQKCQVCGSETFAYISRWIPAPDRRRRPRPPEPSETVTTYRELLSPTPPGSTGVGRWLRRGAFGLAAVTAVGWAWQRRGGTAAHRADGDGDAAGEEKPPDRDDLKVVPYESFDADTTTPSLPTRPQD